VPVRAFGFATVRLFTDAAPGKVGKVEVVSTADDRVQLRWPAVAGAVGYNVFRSVDAENPVTAHTFAGRSTSPAFRDEGLSLDTTYYYRVAAVGPGNMQGVPADRIEVRTATKNVAPPSPVAELGVVREATDRLMVCWRKVPEPDVARYFVYRGDRPDFSVANLAPIAVVKPSGFYLEHHVDTGLQSGKTYHYRVLAEDWAGHRQPESKVASATTPRTGP
jgi:hypothetical protein